MARLEGRFRSPDEERAVALAVERLPDDWKVHVIWNAAGKQPVFEVRVLDAAGTEVAAMTFNEATAGAIDVVRFLDSIASK